MFRLNRTLLYADTLIPYPEVGTWNLNIQGRPLLSSIKSSATDEAYVPLQIKVG